MPVQQVTAKWLAAMQTGSSTEVVVQCAVYAQGAPVAGYQNLPVESLSVTADRNNAQRTTVSLTITPTNGTWFPRPIDLSDVLAPNGNELVISAGFKYSDGTTELCRIGIFPIVTVTTATSGGDLTINVDADDRSWSISRRSLLAPYIVPTDSFGNPTQTVDAAILTLLQSNMSGLPTINYSISPTTNLAPATVYDQGQDPWAAGLDLATAERNELFVDPAGNVQSYPIPDPSQRTGQDWTFVDAPDGVSIPIISASRQITADGLANDLYVITALDTVPQQWEQWDDNPVSPTNIGSKFGRIPNFVQSSVSQNLTAAQQEATGDLLWSLGQADILTLTGVVNAAVLVDDVCLVTCARVGAVNAKYVVDGFSHSFDMSNPTTQYKLRRVYANSSTGQEVPVPSTSGAGYYN